MSPTFVNTNSHRIRVRESENPGVPLRKVAAGEVVEADGLLADQLEATPGVETASDADRERWEDVVASSSGPVSGEGAVRAAEKALIGPARIAARAAAVVPGLNRVVGDDQARLAPPTGTITTKQAIATKDAEHRKAFADNEALPGEEVDDAETASATAPGVGPTGAEVHNAQVQHAEDAQAITEAVNEAANEAASVESDKPAPRSRRRKRSGTRGEQSAETNGGDEQPEDENPGQPAA